MWTHANKIAFFLIVFAYLSLFLGTFPRVYVDEPWDSIPAYQLFFTGVLNNPVLEGRTFNEEHFLAPRVVHLITLGLSYKIFDSQLLVGRMVSLLYAFGVIYVLYKLLYLFGFSLFHRCLAVALLSSNNLFFIFARMIRPEITITFLGLISFYFIAKGSIEARNRPLAWAGLLSGIGACAHPSFILFLLPLAFFLLAEYRREALKKRSLWVFAAFFFVGLSPYLTYVIYQDASHHFAHFWAQISDRAVQADKAFWSQTFLDELTRYRQYAFFPYRVPIVLIEVFFLGLSLRCNDRLSRFSQLVILTHIVLLPVLIVVRNTRHLLPITPFIAILMVRIIQQQGLASPRDFFTRFSLKSKVQKMVLISALALLSYQVVGNPVMASAKRVTGYEDLLEDMRVFIPPNSRVWGSMMFWFGFIDCDYRTDFTYAKDLYKHKPEYVITNDNDIWGTVSSFSGNAKKQKSDVVFAVEYYVHNYGELIATLSDIGYGELKIWKVDTSRTPDHDPNGTKK